MSHRHLLATLCLVLSSLQAWDSHALEAEPTVRALIALAVILVPGALVTTPKTRVHLIAVVASAALLTMARVISAVHMPELVLAAVFPGVIAMLSHVRYLSAAGSQQ